MPDHIAIAPLPQSTVSLRGGGESKSNGIPSFEMNGRNMSKSEGMTLDQTDTIRTIGKLKLRGKTDDLPQDWWFASTAIPLLAATIGPLANVLSIAALVSKWRVTLPNNGQLPEGTDNAGIDIADPEWGIILNAFSLGFGFFGNFCLLLNFTKRVRYIIALPATIISWYFATGILIGITVAMQQYVPPIRPGETYSQGYWYAVMAAILYLIGSMILMINMTGYFAGHYPQHFDLDDDQRTLILQTMMFFFWLAGGAAVFQKVAGFSYADALYFCDVTVLTVGFGDFTAPNDAGRGLVFPYSVIGIIFLGLMINSIRKFALGMSKDKIVKNHQARQRASTYGRTVTSENELRDRLGLPPKRNSVDLPGQRKPSNARKGSTGAWSMARRTSLDQYGRIEMKGRTIIFHEKKQPARGGGRGGAGRNGNQIKKGSALSRDAKLQQRKQGQTPEAKQAHRREKLLLLKEEKDRFDAMREIQANTHKFEKYWALTMSVIAFTLLWCIGALIFYYAEKRLQNLSYFEALYFCYVSLLTIGYGDFSPRSNAGKPFFVVWSLIAIPTMTILISDMSETVVTAINKGTFKLADWTIMPREGVWHDFLQAHPKIKEYLERKTKEREAKKRIEEGFPLADPDEELNTRTPTHNQESSLHHGKTLEKLAEEEPEKTEHELARLLAQAIRRVANDLRSPTPIKYTYEEWVEFTRLIRFSTKGEKEVESEELEEGLVEWDWIGEDSPMLADETEPEWVLERLCESLNRYTRRQARVTHKHTHPFATDKDLEVTFSNPDLDPYSDSHLQKIHTMPPPTHTHPHYPAHPGPRRISAILHHGTSGDEIVPLHRKKKGKEIEDVEKEKQDRMVESSGSGELSGTATSSTEHGLEVKLDKEVERELGLRKSSDEQGSH
ncbi:hypothetical protein B0J14DRAFT_591121 [Halenospora varia]|nr:hypothetical protein B0J14DRAFT_591121 [Halenospora varia]